MIQRFFFAAAFSLLMTAEAMGAWFNTVPIVSPDFIKQFPIERVQAFCRLGGCIGIVHRPTAPYGLRALILISEEQRANLLNSDFPIGDYPDPVAVVAMASTDYTHIMGTAEPIQNPPDGYLPKTDDEIGWKLLYCTSAAVSCMGSVGKVFESGGPFGLVALVHSCGIKVAGECKKFRDSWMLERQYYKKLQDYYRSQGIGVLPVNGGGSGQSADQPIGAGGVDPGSSEWSPGHECVSNTVGMGGGPKGSYVEEAAVDCYYN